jgi:hypothetical protein
MPEHKDQTTADGIHIPYAFSFTTSAARIAYSQYKSTDVGKIVRQTSDNTFWLITATTPTYQQMTIDIGTDDVTAGNILVADGTDWESKAVSGDATLAATGALTVTDLTLGSDAAGDMFYKTSATVTARLAKGTAEQVLHMNSGATAPEWAAADSRGMEFFIAGNAYVAENIVWKVIPVAFSSISKVVITVVTAPTGANLIVDVNYHASAAASATTIFTTQGNRPEIAAAAYTDDSGTPDVTSLAAGGVIGISIDQIGSTVAGADLMVTLVP